MNNSLQKGIFIGTSTQAFDLREREHHGVRKNGKPSSRFCGFCPDDDAWRVMQDRSSGHEGPHTQYFDAVVRTIRTLFNVTSTRCLWFSKASREENTTIQSFSKEKVIYEFSIALIDIIN